MVSAKEDRRLETRLALVKLLSPAYQPVLNLVRVLNDFSHRLQGISRFLHQAFSANSTQA